MNCRQMPIIPINLSLAVGRNILPMALSPQFRKSSGFGQELIMIHFSLASGQICYTFECLFTKNLTAYGNLLKECKLMSPIVREIISGQVGKVDKLQRMRRYSRRPGYENKYNECYSLRNCGYFFSNKQTNKLNTIHINWLWFSI